MRGAQLIVDVSEDSPILVMIVAAIRKDAFGPAQRSATDA